MFQFKTSCIIRITHSFEGLLLCVLVRSSFFYDNCLPKGVNSFDRFCFAFISLILIKDGHTCISIKRTFNNIRAKLTTVSQYRFVFTSLALKLANMVWVYDTNTMLYITITYLYRHCQCGINQLQISDEIAGLKVKVSI